MHLQENTLLDLDHEVKVTQKVAQFFLHYVIYAPTKFAVAMSNGLGGNAFTRNITAVRSFNILSLSHFFMQRQ